MKSWEVHNVNGDTAEIANQLAEYLQQFNHMESLESLNIQKLHLTVDGETVVLEDVEEYTLFISFYAQSNIDNR